MPRKATAALAPTTREAMTVAGYGAAAAPAAARRRPARPRWWSRRQRCAARGHRPARRRRRRGRTAPGPGWPRSWSATTGRTHTAPRTPPIPCGCRAAAGTARPPRRNTSPPGRSWAARRGFLGRSRWPAGRCARPAGCRRAGAARRPSPQSGAAGPATRPAPHGPGWSAAGSPAAHTRYRPTARCAARTSPTGSPHRPGEESRSSPGRTPRRRPHNAGAAPPAAAAGRSSHTTSRNPAAPPRHTAPTPTGAGYR